jgi:hypothetical protein
MEEEEGLDAKRKVLRSNKLKFNLWETTDSQMQIELRKGHELTTGRIET